MDGRRLAQVCSSAMALCCASTGCATIIHGTHQNLYIDSTPDQVRVTVEPGGLEIVTPGCVRVERGGVHRLRFDHPDYEPRVETVYPQAGGLTLLNVPFGGLLGILLDQHTGAAFEPFPNPIDVQLVPRGAPAVATSEAGTDSVDSAQTRVVFFDTSDAGGATAGRAIRVRLDDVHVGTVARGGRLEVSVPSGLHRLLLERRDMLEYVDEYDLMLDREEVYVRVYRRGFSTRFERFEEPPSALSARESAGVASVRVDAALARPDWAVRRRVARSQGDRRFECTRAYDEDLDALASPRPGSPQRQ